MIEHVIRTCAPKFDAGEELPSGILWARRKEALATLRAAEADCP
jgi:hypothetical protein